MTEYPYGTKFDQTGHVADTYNLSWRCKCGWWWDGRTGKMKHIREVHHDRRRPHLGHVSEYFTKFRYGVKVD